MNVWWVSALTKARHERISVIISSVVRSRSRNTLFLTDGTRKQQTLSTSVFNVSQWTVLGIRMGLLSLNNIHGLMILTGMLLLHARCNHSTYLTLTLITSTLIMLTIKSGKMLKLSRKARPSFVVIAFSYFSKGTTSIKMMCSLLIRQSQQRRTPLGRSCFPGRPRWLLRGRRKSKMIAPLAVLKCQKSLAKEKETTETQTRSRKKYDYT